ncbi:hypothetical protein FIBSPDRAFT_916615 [Athelia psychrophila]|uniref:Pyridoxamine 5'-phosphate oxidase putative domain-containing protein n=1 Tax=Athelia psychrophila TaxID=1759441 RepID=A0A166UTW7_9AGAM|nr:hypothetical protein FIBSPDRAFT_916615 [Fibularhizoctonia sp. CBS 109695]
MGQFFDDIPPFLPPWLAEQEMFWVATAPLGGGGHVNVSPKGTRGCFHYVSPTRVWYQDLSGSGNETISHLREPGNGRITILFSAFQGPPRITRLFGTGTVHEYGTPEYDALIPVSERKPGSRSAIVIDVHKVGTSCGYAVPFYAFQAHRTKLLDFFDRRERADRAEGGRSEKGLQAYWAQKNAESMDGMPGLESAFACERVPESVFDEAAEGRASDLCAAGSGKAGMVGGARTGAYAAGNITACHR